MTTPTHSPERPDSLDAALAQLEALLTIPTQPSTSRYDLDIARRADDLRAAIGGIVGHRAPVAFHEIAQRDTDLGDHSGAGARHRRPGPPCSDVLRSRRPQNPTDRHTRTPATEVTR